MRLVSNRPTRDLAQESVERARNNVAGFWREVQWQVTHRAWEVLGYDSFDALWTDQYAAFEVSIPRNLRPELTSSLRAVGQTQQQIADKLGVSQRTVSDDLISNSANENQPTKITNSRGQERPASYQRPKPKPMPPPVPPEDTPELRQRDARALLVRICNMLALNGYQTIDAWADELGNPDDPLTDLAYLGEACRDQTLGELINRADQSARMLAELVERKRS